MTRIRVIAKPGSSKNEIIMQNGNEYMVFLKARPREGKANAELVRLLKKYFKKQARIVSGLKGREKTVEIY